MGNYDDSLKIVERWVSYVKDTHSLTSYNAAMMGQCIESLKCIKELAVVENDWGENYPYGVEVKDIIAWDNKFDDEDDDYLLRDINKASDFDKEEDDDLFNLLAGIDVKYIHQPDFESLIEESETDFTIEERKAIPSKEGALHLKQFINDIFWEKVVVKIFLDIKSRICGLMDRMKNPTEVCSLNAYTLVYKKYTRSIKKETDFGNERWQGGRTLYDKDYYKDLVEFAQIGLDQAMSMLGTKDIKTYVKKGSNGYKLEANRIGRLFLVKPEIFIAGDMQKAIVSISKLETYLYALKEFGKLAESMSDDQGLFEPTVSKELMVFIYTYIFNNFLPLIDKQGFWYFPWRVLHSLKLVSDTSQSKFERTMRTWYPDFKYECKADTMRNYNTYLTTTNIQDWTIKGYTTGKNPKANADALNKFLPVCREFRTALQNKLEIFE